MKKLFLLLPVMLNLFQHPSFSQQSKVDSLSLRLKKTLHDTDRVNTLNRLGRELMYSNPDSTILLAKQAAALAHSLALGEGRGWAKGQANAYSNAGAGYLVKGDYPKALENHFKALKIDEEVFNSPSLGEGARGWAKRGIATRLCNIGIVYADQGDYPKALDYYFKSLKMDEELGNKNGIAIDLGNIGIVYAEQADYPKALDYFFRALKMREELGAKNLIASTLSNIGSVYEEQASAASPSKGGSDSLYKKALDYNFKALKMDEELGNKNHIAAWLGNIGSLYTKTGKYKEAEEHLLQAIAIGSAIGAQNKLRQYEESLSHLYDTLGQVNKKQGNYQLATTNYQLSLLHYKKAMVLKDTIFSEEKDKEITRKEMNYEFEKKEAVAKAEQEKKDAVARKEEQKQMVIKNSFIGGFVLLLILSLIIFRAYQQKQKSNTLLVEKNSFIESQKQLLEEKNTSISDSISYAQHIQESMLIKEDEIKNMLPFETFIFFRPRDIVSGDFYWFGKHDEEYIIAAVDCSGHGVPGAFLSMMGNSLLNEVVNKMKIKDPAGILLQLDILFTETLQQNKSESKLYDGMDIGICSINLAKKEMCFAGAKRPLYVIRNNELEVIKGNSHSIGGREYNRINGKNKFYNNVYLPITERTSIFFTTDGYADQLGGDERRKLGSNRFKELLFDIVDKGATEQKKTLGDFLNRWMGNNKQIDDILVMGVKINGFTN